MLGAISFSHFLNDMIQSLIVAIYPLLKGEFHLNFVQIGAITLTYQVCASVLQPLIGIYTDKHPKPHSLSVGMGFTLIGMLTLALAPNYASVLVAAALVGAGSSIFHPESSRIARLASGGRHGLAQSIFQVGGNAGSAHRAAACRLDHHSARAAQPRLVCIGGGTRHRGAVERERLVQAPAPRPVRATRSRRAPASSPVSSRRVAWSVYHFARAHLLQIFLPGQHHELLQLLPDREIPSAGAVGAAVPVRILARGGARRPDRRTRSATESAASASSGSPSSASRPLP